MVTNEKIEGGARDMSPEEIERAHKNLDLIASNKVKGMVLFALENPGEADGDTHVEGTFYCNGIDEVTRARVGLTSLQLAPETILAWGIKAVTHGIGPKL